MSTKNADSLVICVSSGESKSRDSIYSILLAVETRSVHNTFLRCVKYDQPFIWFLIDQEHSLLLVGRLSCIVFQNERLTWLQVKAASLAILMHHFLNGGFAV